MKINKLKMLAMCLLCTLSTTAFALDGKSIFKEKPVDPEAVYFTPENFNIKADGSVDVSDELQKAINNVKQVNNFGIVFIPEGKYKITKTIYVPTAVRLIGYGENRPLFFLEKNSPGYQTAVESDKGKANYMFWYVSSVPKQHGVNVRDAGAGTFYSAMININLKIEDGNPHAVALRTHFAQHSFIENVRIDIGKGKAGLYDVGNEMANVSFYGGEYGIYTTKTSPSWEMMMVDVYFEGQRKAAIQTEESGFTIVRMRAKNVPTVFEISPDRHDKIFVEDSQFENVSGPAILVSKETSPSNQLTLLNVDCQNVPVLVDYRSGKAAKTVAPSKIYKVNQFTLGGHVVDMNSEPEMKTVANLTPMSKMPLPVPTDLPTIPAVKDWVSILDQGAKGDGKTDDTRAIQAAIDKYDVIYMPQGYYLITETITMRPSTVIIGLNPISTQFIIKESTPSFSGFGTPKPMVQTSVGGNAILSGVGINTGSYNYRAVGCKWQAGEKSYLNDVKFLGVHGTMFKPGVEISRHYDASQISSPTNPVAYLGLDKAWDTQYWSLWITNGGGGIIKDIWTANSYSVSGIYASNTSTPTRIYAMSIEHHIRNEARFTNVSNWRIYAFQLEEESREGVYCLPIEIDRCSDIMFANLYLFRVIRVATPFPYGVRVWDSKNIEFYNMHNFGQMRFAFDMPVYDINKDINIRPWEVTRATITGNESSERAISTEVGKVNLVASGFEAAEGAARDSKGNVYFCEQRLRRIYKWDAKTGNLSLIGDYHWQPLSLACDTKDNLLVAFRYDPQPGLMINGAQEKVPTLPDAAGTTFSAWGNSGFATWIYSIDPNNPDETMVRLPKVKMGSIKSVKKAFYPAHRWRDVHDFSTVSVTPPAECFVATDGVTIIPECYDLARSSSMVEANPGKTFYGSDEYDRAVAQMDVNPDGSLTNFRPFANQGEFGVTVAPDGNVYIADGQVYIYNPKGEKIGMIKVPGRTSSLVFGGADGRTLLMTARSSVYSVKIK